MQQYLVWDEDSEETETMIEPLLEHTKRSRKKEDKKKERWNHQLDREFLGLFFLGQYSPHIEGWSDRDLQTNLVMNVRETDLLPPITACKS